MQNQKKSVNLLQCLCLILLASCSTRDPVKGPVCIINESDDSFSCGESDPMRMWEQKNKGMDGWVCYPKELAKKLWDMAAKGADK